MNEPQNLPIRSPRFSRRGDKQHGTPPIRGNNVGRVNKALRIFSYLNSTSLIPRHNAPTNKIKLNPMFETLTLAEIDISLGE